MFYIITNEGTTKEKREVVKPLATRGDKTCIAYVKGSRVASKWVSTSRVHAA